MTDRNTLITAIAADMASNWWRTGEGRMHIAVVLDRLDELGYSLAPKYTEARPVGDCAVCGSPATWVHCDFDAGETNLYCGAHGSGGGV
jgi:hypothetical protein